MTEEIYIELFDEGTPTIRPTQGVPLGEGLYKVLPTHNYDPEDETWEFLPGTVVKCVRKKAYDGEEILLAVRQVG